MRNAFLLSCSSVIASLIVACSGGGAKTPPSPSVDGGVASNRDGGGAVVATSPPPTGLPPMSTMPPPGVAGSKKAKRRPDAALSTCVSGASRQAKDPAEVVKRLGEACAAASKMKPLSMFRGQQADKEAHQENKFRAEANHCYRLYFAGDEAVKDVVVVLRDSAGDIVAEAPGPSVPEDGSVCFTTSDEVSVLVGIGSGKGAWAAQVWSD